jgi:hypothetical protein
MRSLFSQSLDFLLCQRSPPAGFGVIHGQRNPPRFGNFKSDLFCLKGTEMKEHERSDQAKRGVYRQNLEEDGSV